MLCFSIISIDLPEKSPDVPLRETPGHAVEVVRTPARRKQVRRKANRAHAFVAGALLSKTFDNIEEVRKGYPYDLPV